MLDGVYLNVKDLVGFEQECLEVGNDMRMI